MAINWKQVRTAAKRQDQQQIRGRTAAGVSAPQAQTQISAQGRIDWDAVKGNAQLLDQQQAQSRQRENAYEEAYQQYKQIADSVNHDQLSGYLRTMQERQNQIIGSINHDQMSGYRRTLQEKERQQQRKVQTGTAAQQAATNAGQNYSRLIGLNQFDGELERRAEEWQRKRQAAQEAAALDQERGRRRTSEEYGKRIDALEAASDYARAQNAEGGELPEFKDAYDKVNAGRETPMTLDEMQKELAYTRYKKAVLDKSVSGRGGEYAGDLATQFISGGADMTLGGLGMVLGYLEQGANGAAAWALRDLAKAVPDGSIKDKMLSLADDFSSYYTGESMTAGEESARYYRDELNRIGDEIEGKYKGVPLWIQQQMPSAGNMLFGAGLSGIAGVNNLVTLGLTSGGNSALEAKDKGASDAQALAYGVVAGGLEVFSEKLFGGNPIYDTDAGLVNKAVGKLTDNKTIMKILNSKAFDIASEGLEEVVTEVLDPVAEWAIYNGDNTEFADAASIGNAFLGGVFLSAIGNVADAPKQLQQARYERVLRTAGSELADIAQSVDSADVQEAAQAIRDKIAYGVTPDAADIGAVLDAMDQAGETVDVEQVREAVDAEENEAKAAQAEAAFQTYNQYADERDAKARDAEKASWARSQENTEAINDAEADSAADAFEKLNEAEVKGAADARARQQTEEARAERTFTQESRDDADRLLTDAARRYGFDDRMTSVLLSGYDGAQDAQQYAEDVNAAYEYGRNGMSLSAAQRAAQSVNADVAQEAWNAGRASIQRAPMSDVERYNRGALGDGMTRAAWSAGKGFINGEEAGSTAADESGKRNAGMDSGEQAGAVAEGTGGAKTRPAKASAVAERIELENRVRAAGQPYLSGKDIGLEKGSAQRSFREAPESTWTESMKAAAAMLRREGFKEVHFTVGAISVENQRAKVTRYADGVVTGNTVWINATSKKWTVEQLAKHEAFHHQIKDWPYTMDAVRQALADELGEDGIRELAQRYAEAYEGCYDGAELDAYIEEICADAYAGMDRLPEEKARIVQQAAQRRLEAQSAEKSGETRGPPEKYSYAGKTDSGTEVYETSDAVRRLPYKKRMEIFMDIMRNEYAGRTAKFITRDGETYYARFDEDDLNKNIYGDGKSSPRGWRAKINTGADGAIFELLENARHKGSRGEIGKTTPAHKNVTGWEYFVKTVQIDGRVYDLLANVRKKPEGELVYSIQLNENKRKAPAPPVAPAYTGVNAPDGYASEWVLTDAPEMSVAEKLPPVKERFSLEDPVERTKDLIAVHNKDWSVIRDAALNWGGIPSPSVAIVDAAEGHTKYGDTSVVFPRATIDPEADPRNKVYGGDAWTPTKDNALVEREVNYEARRAFDENIKNLSSQFADGVFQGGSTLGKIGLENETRWEPAEIADKLANHPEVQAAFLQSEGKSLEPVYRDKQFDRFFSNATIQRYLDAVGEQEVARLAVKLMTGERLTAEEMKPAEQAIREVYAEEHANFLNRRPESKEKRIDYYMNNNVFPNRVEDFIRSTQEFYESGGSAGEIDKEATAAKMMEMIAPGGSWNDALRTVKDWVQPQLEGLLGERGIYNGEDAVTDSGRRSFAQTHWDYTAENIVKAMNMAAAKGANMYGVTPETLAATATREYRNVDEMHADEARLRTVSEEEHEKALRDLGIYLDRVVNDLMLTTMHKYDNSFEEEQNLSGIIAEAAKGKKTVAAVKAAFRKEGYAISDGHAKSILALIERAANIPTGYYEAKAQRVVPFSEAAAIIAPTSAPAEEIAAVKAATGVNIIQYETGNDEQRKALVNGLEGVKFSISEDGGPAEAEAAEDAQEEGGTTAFTLDSIPKKAQDYLRRVRGQTAAAIQQTLSMPFAARQEVLKPAIEEMMNEYLQTGRISQETVDRNFEESYRRGVEMDTEFYDQYKDVKTRLRDLKVTLSEADRADIADFDDFRRAASGRLRIANEGGLPVDVAYKEMQQMAPELFPASVTHPADQLMKMFDVSKRIEKVQRSLDEYHGEDAEEFKRWAKNDYEASVENMLGALNVARRYAEARMRQQQARAVPTTMEEVKSLYADLKGLRRTYERAAAKNLLTAEDNSVLNRLLRGEITQEDVQGMENAQGILAMYEAKADYDAAAAKIADWRRYRKGKLREQADNLLKNAEKAKDKKAGIEYSRETMTRNVRDIFPEADAEAINKTYFEPVRTASANANKLKNQLREQVKALDLSRKARKGDAVSEAHAVQLLGEAQDNIRYLEQHPRAQDRDGKTLNEWRQIVLDLWATSPGLDRAKIENAVETFRKIYDGLFEQMNDVRIRNGYEPINYRQGYFPHFQPGTTDGILGLMGKALGIDAEVTALPTTISGLTHTFKPGITYFGNALERIGFDTAYDAVEGFDKYVEGAASVICYTDAIQNLRALAQQVRYRTSDEGLRERVDDIRARDDLTEHQKELEIKEIMDKGQFSLSNFAVELDEYTNLLANKKSEDDRRMEHLGGRKRYNFMRAWQNRVAANMVAVNPASWLTNFGVITQAGAQLKTISVLKGMWQTLANIKTNDGLVEASDFLTNRAGSDPLVRTWQQSASAFLSTPMEWIDQFSAGTIVRARYMENVERGMSEETAMREADDFAANVMADRSKGAMPTLFEARNPLMKMFTQFQLEVNNTYSYLFKDLPREQRKKGVRYLALALFKFLIGGFLYNELYEYFIGRRPTLDPLGIINDTVGDLTGYELNNLVDTAAGGGLIKESEPEGVVGTIQNLAENVGQEAPFIGNLMGGGKLPFSSSMPNVKNILTALDSETATDKEKLAKVGKELVNPAAYWLMPFGGGQIKKMWQGISALKRQGSYTADGRLQYPIYSDRKGDKAGALARTLLFGKSATPEAQAWVEAGFGTLSAKATQTYEAMRAGGVDQRDSYELIKAMSKVKKTDTQTKEQLQMQLLNAFDIEDSGKVLYYYNMMASDKERAQIDNLLAEGADMGEYLRYLQEKSGVTGEKDADGKTISGSVKEETFALIDGLNLTPEQKTELAKEDYTPTGFEPWTENHDKLYKAVSTGKDLRSTLKGLEKDGYEPKEIRAAITGMFRDEYLTADRAGKARLKGYLRNAFMVTGLSQKEAENKIKKWEETQK